jgi:two-component system, cell cycle sensor histidine kinase and response regulator CckA
MSGSLLRSLPDPSFLLTTDARVVEANPATRALTGVAPKALREVSLFPFLRTPEHEVRDYLARCARTMQSLPGSLIWQRADRAVLTRCDGSLVTAGPEPVIFLRCRQQREAIERFASLNQTIQALSREVQQRRALEAALKRSEERYRTVVDATSAVMWVTDPSGAFFEAQPSWEEFTGQSSEEYLDTGGFAMIHPQDRELAEFRWRRCVESGGLYECEYQLWNAKTKAYHHCISRGVPVRDESGAIREWIGTISDIEYRLRLEEQLRSTQKLESLGVLAGGVAHDFNNLLVGILGNASLALETISTNNPGREMLREIVAASEAAAHLTKQLLAYAGKGRFVTELVDLSELVRQITALIQASIPRTVQVRFDLRDRLPSVEADMGQMQQLIMNLIINGAEAVPEGQPGTVLVVTSAQQIDDNYIRSMLAPTQVSPGLYVSLEVHDTGVGMTEDVLGRIFDPFFTTKFTGRGLGLAAVLGIVRGHKGAIKVYSTPGQGTTFKILLPASEQTQPPVRPQLLKESNQDPATILVIDDEAFVRRTAKAMLERFGYSVVVAENGKEGVDLFRVIADKVAVVLLDMTMPVLSGEDTFRELRTIKPDVKVILSSGFNEVEAVRRFTAKGLAGFLQKPYSATALEEKVRSVIDGPSGSS